MSDRAACLLIIALGIVALLYEGGRYLPRPLGLDHLDARPDGRGSQPIRRHRDNRVCVLCRGCADRALSLAATIGGVVTITIDLAGFFTGGMVLLLLLVPVFFATRHERNKYIARVWGEKEIAL